jgi:hypothetical protein
MRKFIVTILFLLAGTNGSALCDTIPKPEVDKLYAEADVVALIKVLSGDTESYDDTVYKASVLTIYKGNVQSTLYFGPYISYGVGSEYLIFLKFSGHQLKSIATKNKTVHYKEEADYLRVMYGGYSILPVGFHCGLGRDVMDCEDSIDAGTVMLPKGFASYRGDPFEKSEKRPIVKKKDFLAYIIGLSIGVKKS